MTSNAPELEPCPCKCGGKPYVYTKESSPHPHDLTGVVVCTDCGFKFSSVAGWNEYNSNAPSMMEFKFDWTHDECAENPTTHRVIGNGYSAFVYIPYDDGNDPESGTGTWNGVAQNRGQSNFASKKDAVAYCERTIIDFAQVAINSASNFLDLSPTPQQAAKVRSEAVEALANYQQADMDGVMVLVSRQAIEECLPALRAIAEQEGST